MKILIYIVVVLFTLISCSPTDTLDYDNSERVLVSTDDVPQENNNPNLHEVDSVSIVVLEFFKKNHHISYPWWRNFYIVKKVVKIDTSNPQYDILMDIELKDGKTSYSGDHRIDSLHSFNLSFGARLPETFLDLDYQLYLGKDSRRWFEVDVTNYSDDKHHKLSGRDMNAFIKFVENDTEARTILATIYAYIPEKMFKEIYYLKISMYIHY